ncbi:DNA cytosine methyltransferase [Streptomyces sp. NPDC087422]|uniref:DNA cytosine methyltransferase n=1 Tax=Streptomyces sp. NPDC087422 TaxID=3365786 RepID=UPI0037FB1ADA
MQRWTFADLFSGAGGMSYGFHAHGDYEMVGAVDAQVGKPSSGRGTLECNSTYAANMGIEPFGRDIATLSGIELRGLLDERLKGRRLDVLSACPPCTGLSRANPKNHMEDDARNSLIAKTAEFVAALTPSVLVMENAREMVQGNFRHHFNALHADLSEMGYKVHHGVHMLSRFGLPQQRERALVIAVRQDHELHTLEELWDGDSVRPEALTVRRAISHLPRVAAGEGHPDDPMHVSPSIGSEVTRRRLEAMPHDGGSWVDMLKHPDADVVLTPAMKKTIAAGKFGSYPDIYGRLWWDRPSPTIKRECSHFGNGRYSHPEQDRLCTVRELALLSGFPANYQFKARAVSNMYRHIGDAVPPMVSYQLAKVAEWVLTGERPEIDSLILPGTTLRPGDIVSSGRLTQLDLAVA